MDYIHCIDSLVSMNVHYWIYIYQQKLYIFIYFIKKYNEYRVHRVSSK
jgi:hypothetical protein